MYDYITHRMTELFQLEGTLKDLWYILVLETVTMKKMLQLSYC